MKSQDSDADAEKAEPARVEEVFHAAAALPEGEQAVYLASACRGDERLAEAVRALLSAGRHAATVWEAGALELEARQTAFTSRPAQPGDSFGPYRIVRRIAAGGMGLVYEARRDDAEFHKRVAIKFLQQGLDDPGVVERFRRERQILAELEHPNIARLLDGGTTPDGVPFLVMEYVDGVPIDRFAKDGRLSRTDRLRLFLQVCDALQYAHRNLVVHRDLKPANILVTPDGVPKLLDFGIAKLLSSDVHAATTTIHALTPEYASPEQVLGRSVGTASDVYSLGVLLCVLLADRLPYGADAGRPADLVRAIGEDAPVWQPPGLIQGDLHSILAQALRKEPDRRYLSVEQFSADVRRYLAGLPVAARPDSIGYRARKFLVRRAVPVAAVLAIGTATLIGGLSTLAQWRRGERRFNEVRGLAHAMLFDVYDSISALPGSVPVRRLVVSRAQEYLDSLAREAGNDPVLVRELADSYVRLGDVRGKPYRPNLGDTAGALESYRKAQALLERMTALHPNDARLQESLVEAYMGAGRILERQRSLQADIDVMQRAIHTAEGLHARSPQNLVYTEQLARATQYLGGAQYMGAVQSRSVAGFQQTLETYQRALAIQEAAGPQIDESWQRSLSTRYLYIGYALKALGDLTGDVSYHQRALDSSLKGHEIVENLALTHAAQPDAWISRSLADDLSGIGILRWKCCRDMAGALRDLRESLQRHETLAATDPDNIEARRDVAGGNLLIGIVLAESGRTREALDPHLKALAIYQEVQRADPTSQEDAGYVAEIRARIAALERAR